MGSSKHEDGNWRRQAATFAAGAFSLIGLGTVLVVFMVSRESRKAAPEPKPPVVSSPTPGR